MVHGKAKIELYNPNTKIKNIIRSENTFQNSVLASYMRDMGEANCSPYNNSNFYSSKNWTDLVGGILLFESTESIGNKYMSAGNKMVGNGSYQVSNNDAPSEFGTYNISESSASASGITQVYDFATNQANGNISCVCLTSQTGGFIGYGNTSDDIVATRYSLDRHQDYGYTDLSNSEVNAYAVIYGNIKYTFSCTSGILTVTKTKVAISSCSVFNGFKTTKTFDLNEIGNHGGIVSEKPRALLDGDDIYLMFSKGSSSSALNIAPNGTAYLYKFNPSDESLAEISFVNTTQKNVRFSTPSGTKSGIACGRIFLMDTDNSAYHVIVLDSSIYEAQLPIISQNHVGWQNFTAGRLTNSLALVFGKKTTGNHQDYRTTLFVYDTNTHTCRPTNGYFFEDDNTTQNLYYDKVHDVFQMCDISGNHDQRIRFFHHPLYLATINNLNSPVTKTAAQTMKITYTLTES